MKKVAIILMIALLIAYVWSQKSNLISKGPVRIGAIYSLTGTMAVSERPLIDTIEMAVEEINTDGGLLGRKVEVIVADGKSSPDVAAKEAERLISEEHVNVLIACWTSACRKAVKPVVERHNTLMFYPVQYEGMEESNNIIYTGAAPNQQIVPGTRWMTEQFGDKVYLAASDYIFPRTANLIIKDILVVTGGTISGEKYLPLGSADVGSMVNDIVKGRPDLIINTINGDTNMHFFKALKDKGLQDIPIMSFSVSESDLLHFGGNGLKNHYGTWSYFSSTDNEENREFVAAFKKRFGNERSTSDPIFSTYISVRLWADNIIDNGSFDPEVLNNSIIHHSYKSSGGMLSVDRSTRHLWRTTRIGKVMEDGSYKEVWSSGSPIRPTPYPLSRNRAEWNDILKGLTERTAQ